MIWWLSVQSYIIYACAAVHARSCIYHLFLWLALLRLISLPKQSEGAWHKDRKGKMRTCLPHVWMSMSTFASAWKLMNCTSKGWNFSRGFWHVGMDAIPTIPFISCHHFPVRLIRVWRFWMREKPGVLVPYAGAALQHYFLFLSAFKFEFLNSSKQFILDWCYIRQSHVMKWGSNWQWTSPTFRSTLHWPNWSGPEGTCSEQTCTVQIRKTCLENWFEDDKMQKKSRDPRLHSFPWDLALRVVFVPLHVRGPVQHHHDGWSRCLLCCLRRRQQWEAMDVGTVLSHHAFCGHMYAKDISL